MDIDFALLSYIFMLFLIFILVDCTGKELPFILLYMCTVTIRSLPLSISIYLHNISTSHVSIHAPSLDTKSTMLMHVMKCELVVG